MTRELPLASDLASFLLDPRGFIDRRVAERLARPLFVHQKSIEITLGWPARHYLEAAQRGAFATSKERKLVLARTEDVVAYLDSLQVDRASKPEPVGPVVERDAFARVGARRVG